MKQGKTIEYRSILVPERDECHQKNQSQRYCQLRKQSLQNLSDKYATQLRLPSSNSNNNSNSSSSKYKHFSANTNVRYNYYMNQYKKNKDIVDKQRTMKQAYLNSEEYQTVFMDYIEENCHKKRQQRQLQKIRKQMNDKWQNYYQQPQKDQHNHYENQNTQQPEKYKTVLHDYRDDPNKQKQLYLIDLQIGRIKMQEQITKKVQNKKQMCNNQKLLSKMSKNILSAYMVNFQEIFTQLMDDVLKQQVLYYNYIEAEYHVEKKQYNGNDKEYMGYGDQGNKLSTVTDNMRYREQYENAKALQMMELVKQLEDLCDDRY